MGQLRKDNQFLLEEVKQLQNKVQEKSGRKKIKHVDVKRSTRVSQFINIYLLIISEVLTRRVSALLDDLSLFASRIVFLRDVSPPFSGKILMVHIVAKREGKKNGLVSVQITSAVKNELV